MQGAFAAAAQQLLSAVGMRLRFWSSSHAARLRPSRSLDEQGKRPAMGRALDLSKPEGG
jgi:hypothetical protein